MQVELICKEGFTEKATECTDYHNTETNFRIAPRTRQAPTEEHRGTGGGEREQQLFEKGQDTIERYMQARTDPLSPRMHAHCTAKNVDKCRT